MENIAGQTDSGRAITKYRVINNLILPFANIDGVRQSGI